MGNAHLQLFLGGLGIVPVAYISTKSPQLM